MTRRTTSSMTPRVMRQEVRWIPENRKVEGVEQKPTRIWTLFPHCDAVTPPALPIQPVHHQNAFLEDFVHDWNYNPQRKEIRYYSRAMDHSVWVLMEFEDSGKCRECLRTGDHKMDCSVGRNR